jgi:hypothetical protein
MGCFEILLVTGSIISIIVAYRLYYENFILLCELNKTVQLQLDTTEELILVYKELEMVYKEIEVLNKQLK